MVKHLQLSLVALLTGTGLVAALPSFLTPLTGRSSDGSDSLSVDRRATGGKVTSKALARFDNSNIEDGMGNGTDWYHLYLGNGTEAAGWPSKDKWVSFEDMFNNYKLQMYVACQFLNWRLPNNDIAEVEAIYDGIQMAADASGVDHRLILAIIMQESHGCVRVNTTNLGVQNPGIMQNHNGKAFCNDNKKLTTPCPAATIHEMIREGTSGTSSGDGLAHCINLSGNGDVSDYYRAARIYNSGSISKTGNLESNIATHCYASDVANRLTGWVYAPSTCTCDDDPKSCGVVNH
ncbi:hypothetical protein MKX07_003048 [Trichoderma sp. CBMAI-0711]|nr:hypothetical protein MKX07_003048 [Trichoderma sp. CBMAI-0711]